MKTIKEKKTLLVQKFLPSCNNVPLKMGLPITITSLICTVRGDPVADIAFQLAGTDNLKFAIQDWNL